MNFQSGLSEDDLPSKNIFKEYRVQCKIGEGSFSEVLRCQNRESGQLIAAKRLKKSFLSPHDAAEIPEVIAMRKLPQHPNILHLVEAHYEAAIGKVTLIFDLMDMSIYDMMRNRKRPLPESRVKNYLYQILKGVTHLHNHGIFHRDIKPENILIKGEQIKIADLGSVRGVYSRKPYTEYISTRWYRSPECLLTSGYYGPKMDVWAIGCVFYELLTLKPLFPGSNEVDQIAKIHTVLGTPNQELISRFRRHKSQLMDINFPQKPGTGFGPLLQNLSENGREILKIMLTYDPKIRSATRRLIENRYFNDLRESDLLRKRVSASSTSSVSSNPEWRNPVLLSFMTSERKRKQKQINVMQSKVPRPIQSMPFKTARLKTPIPRLLKDPGRTSVNHPKPTTNKILNKTGTKPKIVQRQVQNIQQMPQKPINVLQETTNILPTPRKIPIPTTGSASIPHSQVRNNYNTSSASFLPSLSVKQNVPLLRSIPHKHRSFPHGVVSSRHFIPKSFLNSANKPRLAPILEHVHLDNGLA